MVPNGSQVVKLIHWVLVFSVFLSSAVSAEVIDRSESGFTLQTQREFDATPKEVYDTLTLEVHRWWNLDHTYAGKDGMMTMDTTPGGCFCESLPGGGWVEHMRIVYVEPNKLLRMSGGLGPLQSLGVAGAMSFTLSEEEGKTVLVFRYQVGGYFAAGTGQWPAAVDGVWDVQLDGLKRLLDDGVDNGRGLP